MRRTFLRLVLLSVVVLASGCHERADIRILNETSSPLRIEMAINHRGLTVGDFQPYAWRVRIEPGGKWWSRTAEREDIDNTLRRQALGRTLVRVRRASLHASGWDEYAVEGRRFVIALREEDAPRGVGVAAFLVSNDGMVTPVERAPAGMFLNN